MKIDRIPLLPGRYELRAAITEREGGAVVCLRGYDDGQVERVTIEAPPGPAISIALYRKNVMLLPLRWEQSTG